jgi:hypothetical protein
MYMLTIALIGYFRPGFLPTAASRAWRERFTGLKTSGRRCCCSSS